MIAKIFALFALLSVALAAPSPAPKAAPGPAPAPQYLTYSPPLDYVYPSAYSGLVSPYAAPAPLAYAAYPNLYYR